MYLDFLCKNHYIRNTQHRIIKVNLICIFLFLIRFISIAMPIYIFNLNTILLCCVIYNVISVHLIFIRDFYIIFLYHI